MIVPCGTREGIPSFRRFKMAVPLTLQGSSCKMQKDLERVLHAIILYHRHWKQLPTNFTTYKDLHPIESNDHR